MFNLVRSRIVWVLVAFSLASAVLTGPANQANASTPAFDMKIEQVQFAPSADMANYLPPTSPTDLRNKPGKECAGSENDYCAPSAQVVALGERYPVVFYGGGTPWTFCCRCSTEKLRKDDLYGLTMKVFQSGIWLPQEHEGKGCLSAGIVTFAYMKGRTHMKIKVEVYAAEFGKADRTMGRLVAPAEITDIGSDLPHWNKVGWTISTKSGVVVPTADYRWVITPLDTNGQPFVNPDTGKSFVMGTNPENSMTRCSIDPIDTPDLIEVMRNSGLPEWNDVSNDGGSEIPQAPRNSPPPGALTDEPL